jgi:hypothetical protein
MTRPTGSGAGPGQTGPTATGTATYEIRVAGHLDDHWAATLGDLALVHLDDGTTSLTGPVVDQAQLHGVLARIRDLGVPLLTLRTLDCAGTAAKTESETQSGVGAPGGYQQGEHQAPDPLARRPSGRRPHVGVPAAPLRG